MMRPRRIDPSIASQTPEVVFSLIGRCLADEPSDAFREVSRRGLWEYVAAEACDAGVGGLLLNQATRYEIDLPASAARQMRAYSEHVAAANAYKLQAIHRPLVRLQMAKVQFMLLKGAALNSILYEPGTRPMSDVDVLIRAADVHTAHKVLINAGCRPGPDLVRSDFYPRFYCEREYFTNTRPHVKIDLHCRPFHLLRYARTVPESAMWNDAVDVKLGNVNVKVPGPESMLVHLAVHAACHGGTELRWLHDIKAWLDRFGSRIDTNRLAQRCRRWRLSLPLNRALLRTQEAFGGNELVSSLVQATRGSAGPLDRLALAAAPLAATAPALHTVCNALTAPGIRFRLGYLSAVLLPGSEHLGQVYGGRHFGWRLAAHATRISRAVGLRSPSLAE